MSTKNEHPMDPENLATIKTPIRDGGLGWYVLGQEEIDAVTSLMREPQKMFRYRGSEPTQCSMLESEVASAIGVKHALLVNSGTSALTCCLVAWEIGPGDEVIVPAYTYIATATAVINAGAVPVIAEIDDSLGLSPADVRQKITPFTKAIIAVHMQGVPAKMAELWQIAREHGLIVIEDCCQAIGSQYRGRYTGTQSHAFAWSLNYYKVITAGEGGMFFTNDDAAFLRGVYQSDAATPMWDSNLKGNLDLPVFSKAGYRSSEVHAAIAREQFKKLGGILAHCRRLKRLLLENLDAPIHYQRQHVDDPEGDCGISFAMIANSKAIAQQMAQAANRAGLPIGTAYNDGFPDRHIYSNWVSILNKQGTTRANYPWGDPGYKGNVQYSKDMCPQTLEILGRCLRLGIHMGMTEQNMLEIAAVINSIDRSL
jgi:dTDP-4-amino-4,6-dideoxygalactose transaminase